MAGTIHRTVFLLKEALESMSVRMRISNIERISLMVNKAMSSQARSFHTSEHIFNLADADKPIQTLAALFHDIVYFHIDKGFIEEIEMLLDPYIVVKADSVFLKKKIPNEDEAITLNLAIFGFKAGDELPAFGGMNEFLSSVVMAKALQGTIDTESVLKVAACIEATIPFRGPDETGKSPAEILFARLEVINKDRSIGVTDEELVEAVKESVIFANRDVENFAENRVALFLDNTWKLLPETNPSLRTTGIFTVLNYRIALQKMEGFLGFLDPDRIFSCFRSVPLPKVYDKLVKRATRNVIAARDYLGIKLLTTGILEAIAMISGGDAPIALFMGDVSDKEEIAKFENMLPVNGKKGSMSSTIRDLLAQGRNSSTDFDLKNSPLANYLYSNLTMKTYGDYLQNAKAMFDNKMKPKKFLDNLPKKLILPVVKACSEMAFTRRKSLSDYIQQRKK